MASPSTVISRGYGSWGSVNLLPTLGYGIAAVAEAPPPLYRPKTATALDAYRPGAVGGPAAYRPLASALPTIYRPNNPTSPGG